MRMFLDTVYVVALVNRRDQHHLQAQELASHLEGCTFVTTDAVLLEIGNALARRFKPEAAAILANLLSSTDVELIWTTPEAFAEAVILYQSHQDQPWGLTDCLSFVVMRREGIDDALTFDQHFVQAGFRALMRESRS